MGPGRVHQALAFTKMLSRTPGWLLVLALGAVVLLPGLGNYGLWDPTEVRPADNARRLFENKTAREPPTRGPSRLSPPLTSWLIAIGFRLFGVNEFAGRIPIALCGLLALLLVWRVGRRLDSEAAGLLAALVLLTCPAFIFQSRQLSSHIVLNLALMASIGGFAAYVVPADNRRSSFDLFIGCLGLIAGCLTHSVVLGAILPLVALALTVLIDRPDAAGGDPRERPTTLEPVGWPLWVGLALSTAVIGLLVSQLGGADWLLGGQIHRSASAPTFDAMYKQTGFAFFPWVGLLPASLAFFLQSPASMHARGPRFATSLILVALVLAYVTTTFLSIYVAKVTLAVLPLLSVAVGLLLMQMLATGSQHRLWALLALALIVALQQDYTLNPESLAFSHLSEAAKFPAELNIKNWITGFGVGFALLFYLALGGMPRPRKSTLEKRRWEQLSGLRSSVSWMLNSGIDRITWLADRAAWPLRQLGGRDGRNYCLAAGGLAITFAVWCSWYLLPELSLHLSNKALFETYHRCREGQQPLAQYMVSGRGAAYYNDGKVQQLSSRTALFNQLKAKERSFVLIPAGQLAAIDQAARRDRLKYYVLDDRNSQYLILSNQLSGNCARDVNPLRRLVVKTRPSPQKPLVANFENRVKLLGYDLKDTVRRGGKFAIKLYFEVLSRMPSGYKLFIHFDQPAHRFHGDHKPLGGKYPTQYWLPGDFIIDPHEVEIPLLTTPSGTYKIYAGFWLGSKRLKVTEGPNDGVNRVLLGTLRVR